jgi:hypothetical protein
VWFVVIPAFLPRITLNTRNVSLIKDNFHGSFLIREIRVYRG